MNNCPLESGCNLSNCEFCEQKMDCILLSILKKVEKLESMVAQKTSA
jgi:hypothetical protein